MPGNNIEVTGMKELLRNLKLVEEVPHTKEAKQIFFDAGKIVRNYARHFAPYGKTRTKGTHLRDAILVSKGPLLFTDVLVTVRYKRPGAPHAHLIEFGTVKSPAHPFMRPAASTAKVQVQEVIKKQLIALIKATPR